MHVGHSCWGYYVYARETGSKLSSDLVFSEVAKAGVHGIELSWPLDELLPPIEYQRQLERYGLTAVAYWLEVTFDSACLDEAERRARFLHDVGGSVLVCEGQKQTAPMTPEQYTALYRQFEAVACICEQHDIRAAFHFHRGCLETEREVRDFFEQTRGVWFCPDIGHAAALSWDPLPVIRDYRDKVVHVHLKDARIDPATGQFERFIELGAGNSGVDIPACLNCLTEIGYDGWAMIEQDHVTFNPGHDLLQSCRFLESLEAWNP